MHDCHRKKNSRTLWIVLVLSSSYCVAEIVGGLLSGSLALLADAGHMAIDVAAIALGLFAIWIAQKPPNDKKTYGYYRAEILAAMINGAALVALAIWILIEAYQRYGNPQPIQGQLMTLVAMGGLVVNSIALFLTHGSRDHGLNMRGVWLHIASDTLGSLSAITAGICVWLWGWTMLDPIISAFIAVLILYNSWKLLSESVNVLLEGVPDHLNLDEIRGRLEGMDAILDVHDLHIWTVTSGVHALSAHIKIKEGADSAELLADVTNMLRTDYQISHSTVQLEPASFTHQALHF